MGAKHSIVRHINGYVFTVKKYENGVILCLWFTFNIFSTNLLHIITQKFIYLDENMNLYIFAGIHSLSRLYCSNYLKTDKIYLTYLQLFIVIHLKIVSSNYSILPIVSSPGFTAFLMLVFTSAQVNFSTRNFPI